VRRRKHRGTAGTIEGSFAGERFGEHHADGKNVDAVTITELRVAAAVHPNDGAYCPYLQIATALLT
jgi:hypothetical protein